MAGALDQHRRALLRVHISRSAAERWDEATDFPGTTAQVRAQKELDRSHSAAIASYPSRRNSSGVRLLVLLRVLGRTAMLDLNKAVKYLDDNAEGEPNGHCARYVREALQAGGLDLTIHPGSAKDYGETLLAAGFKKFYEFRPILIADPPPEDTVLPQTRWAIQFGELQGVVKLALSTAARRQDYQAGKGDVAVIQPYQGGDPNGHICMYDGDQWVSDFKQRDMWGGPGYRKNKPVCIVYRP
jgi:hypothetical protein